MLVGTTDEKQASSLGITGAGSVFCCVVVLRSTLDYPSHLVGHDESAPEVQFSTS